MKFKGANLPAEGRNTRNNTISLDDELTGSIYYHRSENRVAVTINEQL